MDNKQRAVFLSRIHLFVGMKLEQLEEIASRMEERPFPADAVIFERDTSPDGFYLIFNGSVKIIRRQEDGKSDEVLARLSESDYFGEEALVEHRKRSAAVQALEDSLLLFLSRERFDELIKKHEQLKPNFDVAIKSRRLARATRFKWVEPNEVVYFIARRHKIRLYQVLLAPLFALAFPLALVGWSFIANALLPMVAGGILAVVVLGWAVWRAIDWSNDYYIVTNQRVVWLERVIGIYDNRQEAPLATILSVNVETDVIGRILDYGNVSVRTFVGNIKFDYVDHPNQAADMIRELWERTKSRTSKAQKEAMKNALRVKLGMPPKETDEEEAPPPGVPADKEVQKKGLFRIALGNMFKLRTEEGGTVIYHKHWFVLFKQLSRPLFFFVLLLALLISRVWSLARDPSNAVLTFPTGGGFIPDTFTVVLMFFILFPLGWLVWEYVDWNNDIFKVTPEEIMDLDRTPLGTEERRTALIENILSTEYQRVGLTGYLFNYGTVYIVVGGTKLSFQDVLDPAGVQADINRRRMARIAQKNEETARIERERMAAWLAAYHENRSEFTEGESPLEEDELARLGKAAGQDLEEGMEGTLDDQFAEGAEG
jgi:CRP-like cAMP-binding protein